VRSLARIGLDRLLEFYPHFDVVRVEWQREGPWLLVDIGQPSEHNGTPGLPDAFALHPFAIWKATGAVYGMTDGAVNDEPLLSL
jgi:hypothetical protein